MNTETLKILGAILLPNIGGFVNGGVAEANLKHWYNKLKLPSYCPPNWVFAPVWASLFSGMGYASYLVWRDGGGFVKGIFKILYCRFLILRACPNWLKL